MTEDSNRAFSSSDEASTSPVLAAAGVTAAPSGDEAPSEPGDDLLPGSDPSTENAICDQDKDPNDSSPPGPSLDADGGSSSTQPSEESATSPPDGATAPGHSSDSRIRLSALATEITELESSISNQVLTLAEKVREARTFFDASIEGETSWAMWVKDNLPFKVTRANQLLQIADAPSPSEELSRQRALGRARNKKYQDKKRAEPSRDGEQSDSISDLQDDPDRQFLREWVVSAPIADIKRVKWFLSLPTDVVERYRQIADTPLPDVTAQSARDKYYGYGAYQSAEATKGSTYGMMDQLIFEVERSKAGEEGSTSHEQ